MEKKKVIKVVLRYKISGKKTHIDICEEDLPRTDGVASSPCGLHRMVQKMNDELISKKINDKLVIESINKKE